MSKDSKAKTPVEQPEVAKEDTTWKDNPKAKIRRVFRATNPLTKVEICTLMRKESIVNGNTIPALTLTLKVNPAAQYILSDLFSDDEYQDQLRAMRIYEAKGICIEMPPSWEGKLYVEPAPLTPAELKAEELRIKCEEYEKRIKELEERTK